MGRRGFAAVFIATVLAAGCAETPGTPVHRAAGTPAAAPSDSPSSAESPSSGIASPSPGPSRNAARRLPRGTPPAPAPRVRCAAAPASAKGGPGRRPTPQAPLDLVVTGDSMPEFMGPQLAQMADAKHRLAPCVEIHYSTGLVREDFFDWPRYASQLMARRDPEAVVFFAGGNDGQNFLVDGHVLEAGSAEWAAEYRSRAERMMRTFSAGGRRTVYWIGMPGARSARLHGIYRVLDAALREAAAAVSGVRFVDTWPMFTTSDGRYADRLPNEYGAVQPMRGKDGIHLSREGALFLARHMVRELNEDWHLTD